MRTETITIYSYSELSEEAKATAYKAWKPDYAFEADNHRTLEAFCTAFGIEVTEYVYEAYYHSFRWRAKNEGDEEITDNEYIRHCLSLFEPTGFYLDDVILGPAKQPTEGKVFGNVIEECLEAFFSACCEDVKYAEAKNISRTSRIITNLNFTKMVFVYDIGKSRWQADFGREALEFGRDHFTIDTGNYVITVDPKKYRIFDRAAGKPLVNGVVRIDEQDMKDILAAAPKSQRGWIRTRLGYMVIV